MKEKINCKECKEEYFVNICANSTKIKNSIIDELNSNYICWICREHEYFLDENFYFSEILEEKEEEKLEEVEEEKEEEKLEEEVEEPKKKKKRTYKKNSPPEDWEF